jgi:hypothetical protein
MNKTIAVEHNLTPVIEYLSEKGYKVKDIDFGREYGKNIDKYDAVVVTGMNKDFLGVQDIVSKIPVIDAKGLTAEEVFSQLNNTLKQ